MNKELRGIIKDSTFEVIDEIYVYAKVKKMSEVGECFAVIKDRDEITVVAEKKNLKHLDLIEKNEKDYCLIALNVSIPFYSVGFLAAVSNAIASAGMNILILSTYSKDYILVKYSEKSKAVNALTKLGLKAIGDE